MSQVDHDQCIIALRTTRSLTQQRGLLSRVVVPMSAASERRGRRSSRYRSWRTRRDVWKLGAGWGDTLTWYARGVSALQQRPITDRTSWAYLASLHGFDERPVARLRLLRQRRRASARPAIPHAAAVPASKLVFPAPGIAATAPAPPSKYHRAATPSPEKLGGPADWALHRTGTTAMPPTRAPASRRPPSSRREDARRLARPLKGGPALRREDGAGRVVVDRAERLGHPGAALSGRSEFPGDASGGWRASGGPDTPFSHTGSGLRATRQLPAACSRTPRTISCTAWSAAFAAAAIPTPPWTTGLMSMPGHRRPLIRFFWLHHANIDRLWEVWLRRDAATHHNRRRSRRGWTGPAGRKFEMPGVDGAPFAPCTARKCWICRCPGWIMSHEDVSDPLGGRTRANGRPLRDAGAAGARAGRGHGDGGYRGASTTGYELLGANGQAVAPREAKSASIPRSRWIRRRRGKLSASFAPRGLGMAGAAARARSRLPEPGEHPRRQRRRDSSTSMSELPPGAKPEGSPGKPGGARVALVRRRQGQPGRWRGTAAAAWSGRGDHQGHRRAPPQAAGRSSEAQRSSSCRGTSCCRRTTSRSSGSATSTGKGK